MNRTALKTAPERPTPLLHQHEALARHIPGRDGWLGELRAAALDRYRRNGLPGRGTEAWKYTNLSRLAEVEFHPARLSPEQGPLELPTEIAAVEGCRLILVNGTLDRQLCDFAKLPKGVVVSGIGQEIETHPARLQAHLGQYSADDAAPLAALNTASFHDGIFLHVPEGVIVSEPIHIISIGAAHEAALSFHPRILVVLERGAQATLVESHAGIVQQPYLSNGVTEIVVGPGAVLRHDVVQDESPHAWHLNYTAVAIGEGGRYESTTVQAGARLARRETHVALNGTRAECRLDGAYVADGESHVDNTTRVEHLAPHCTSKQLWKGVLSGSARGVYQGKVLVARGAQKTDAHQLSRALLLSKTAEMDGKPELEIYADDVKCGHGATVGDLDQNHLFYLESRGIDREEAKRMLIEAFVAEVLDNVTDERVREALARLLRHRLDGRR